MRLASNWATPITFTGLYVDYWMPKDEEAGAGGIVDQGPPQVLAFVRPGESQ